VAYAEVYKTASGFISLKQGTEGPKHDPYGYEEWVVERKGRPTAKIHIGLAFWSEVDGKRLDKYDEVADTARFEKAAGFTLVELSRILARADQRRNAACPWGDWRHDPMGRASDYE
jgi:hypothetical protein